MRFQRLWCENLHKSYVKHLNYKLYYPQLHLKHLCNLAGIDHKPTDGDTIV
jgi:hypothetical protein